MFSFLRHHQTVFHSICTVSHSHLQQCMQVPISPHLCQQIFFPVCGLPFHSFNSVFLRAVFNFHKAQLINFFFPESASGVVSKKSSSNPKSPGFCPMLFPVSLIVLCFEVRSMIHLQLIFMNGENSVFRFIVLRVDVQLLSTTG